MDTIAPAQTEITIPASGLKKPVTANTEPGNENLTANIAGRIQHKTVNGKSYLVAPLSLIVPGVLAGSKGPLYYPPEEVQNGYQAWEKVPLVVYHPVRNGQNVSAQHPGVLDESGIGFVKNAHISKQGKLRGYGYFDVEKTKQVDHRIYDRLVAGDPIELSTGLFTTNEPAPRGSNHNGKPYSFIARDYRPDHLAILPDQVGACSLNDGCGVLVNQESKMALRNESSTTSLEPEGSHFEGESDMALTADDRVVLVNALIANCDCYKNLGEEVLNGLPDEKLLAIAQVEENKLATNASKKVRDEEEDEEEEDEEEELEVNSAEKWFQSAPPAIRSAVQNAMRIETREKQAIVQQLVANLHGADRKRMTANLMNKSLSDLEDLKLLMPTANNFEEELQQATIPNYFGAAVGRDRSPTTNRVARDEVLDLPVFNWTEIAKAN